MLCWDNAAGNANEACFHVVGFALLSKAALLIGLELDAALMFQG